MVKARLDILLVEQGLVESRSLAQRMIMAGQVRVNDQMVLKPAALVAQDAELSVNQGPPFVSRGGEKLAAALETFPISVAEKICADVGASTGGFTDCLLQHGAVKVYAIDVGHGILHWKLRQDPRVVVMERTNARHLVELPEQVDVVTIDASFISLKVLLPVITGWLKTNGSEIIALIKPQFEAGKSAVARGEGVIRDPNLHRQILQEILTYCEQQGFGVNGLIRSPLLGPKGNVEFLAWFGYPQITQADLSALINAAAPAGAAEPTEPAPGAANVEQGFD
ncbi:MAG TPA: TlyA family RNA methyltransferase [Anaerolineales bacterium]|nr:TlyA family RNA methyltransferase [Anaerolineales bacterium]